MKYQLLVLDIDGTTANSKKEVDEETRNALIWLQSSGIKVVLASGAAAGGRLSCGGIPGASLFWKLCSGI